jgi:hypothetical protein
VRSGRQDILEMLKAGDYDAPAVGDKEIKQVYRHV